MSTNNQSGFSTVEAIAIFVVVAIIGFTGWFVWSGQKASKSAGSKVGSGASSSVTTYKQCVKANGSKILETYPEQCVTKDGKSFTAPTSQTLATTLAITEWGVQLPLTADIADATYTMGQDGTVHITSAKLLSLVAKQTGCKSGLDDVYIQRTTTVSDSAVKVGSYYYALYHPIQPACVAPTTSDTEQILALKKSLTTAVQSVTAEAAN